MPGASKREGPRHINKLNNECYMSLRGGGEAAPGRWTSQLSIKTLILVCELSLGVCVCVCASGCLGDRPVLCMYECVYAIIDSPGIMMPHG